MEQLKDFVAQPLVLAIGLVATVVGCVAGIWAILASRQAATKKDIERLEGEVTRLAEYLDGLLTTDNKPLHAAFEDGRRLQLEGYMQEGYAAQSADKHREAIENFGRALEMAETDSQRAALHVLRGNSYADISQYNEAQADYDETLRLADSIPDAKDAAQARAVALDNLGLVDTDRDELEKAEKHHRQALDIAREIGNRLGEAGNLSNLGLVYLRRDELEKAEEHHKRALQIAREIGNRLGEGKVLGNLGLVYRRLGKLEAAEKHLKMALEIQRQIGDRRGEANQLGNLGNVYADRGELKKAEELHKEALNIEREIGYRLGEANSLGNLGLVYRERGDLGKAKQQLQEAQAIFQQIGAGREVHTVRRALEAIEEVELRQREGREGKMERKASDSGDQLDSDSGDVEG